MSKPETVVEDFLDEDTEIPGQRYALLSFISPEKVLDRKDIHFFTKFMQSYEVDWKVKNLEKFMVETVKYINDQLDEKANELEKADQADAAQICRKNRLLVDNVMTKYESFIKQNKSNLNKTSIKEAYDDFMFANKDKLEREFHEMNDFRTSMRGVKIRGVFSNPKEAEIKAKKLQAKDKYHNIFMAEVGKWTPWDPNASDVQDQDYNNDQLNSLMRKYKENEDSREKFFEERTKDQKKVISSAASDSSSSASASSSRSSYDGLFSGSGDLALQRKMEQGDSKE